MQIHAYRTKDDTYSTCSHAGCAIQTASQSVYLVILIANSMHVWVAAAPAQFTRT